MLPPSPVPSLPVVGLSVAEEVAALRVAVSNLGSIITNFNAGGVTETYLEATSIALGNDASTVTNGTLAGVYEALNNVQNAAFILTAVGVALDNKAADVGVYRKAAVAASETMAIVFYPNAPPSSVQVIPAGIILSAPNADPTIGPTLYQTTSDATVNVGATQSTPANVSCLTTGSNGNCAPGSINQIVAGVSGFTATNVAAIGGGADTESDASLRERALNAVPAAAQSTVFALQQAALTYPGIQSAAVYDLTSPPPALVYPTLGEVQIFCDDGTGTLGSLTNTTEQFVVPNVGLTFQTPVVNPVAFNVGDNVAIAGENTASGTVQITAAVTNISDTTYTLRLSSLTKGSVGDIVIVGANVQSPNSGALASFNTDLTKGYWKAAGAQAHAWGSTQVAIVLYMEVYLNQDYLTDIASEAEVLAAIQLALFNQVNALAIGRPVTLSSLIDTAGAVGGVSEVPVTTVLINGANADFGVTNGIVSLVPSQTCRIASLSGVTVVNRLTVPY
jgi:hypothetical protein